MAALAGFAGFPGLAAVPGSVGVPRLGPTSARGADVALSTNATVRSVAAVSVSRTERVGRGEGGPAAAASCTVTEGAVIAAGGSGGPRTGGTGLTMRAAPAPAAANPTAARPAAPPAPESPAPSIGSCSTAVSPAATRPGRGEPRATKARTTCGSKWVPEQRTSSAIAAARLIGSL